MCHNSRIGDHYLLQSVNYNILRTEQCVRSLSEKEPFLRFESKESTVFDFEGPDIHPDSYAVNGHCERPSPILHYRLEKRLNMIYEQQPCIVPASAIATNKPPINVLIPLVEHEEIGLEEYEVSRQRHAVRFLLRSINPRRTVNLHHLYIDTDCYFIS